MNFEDDKIKRIAEGDIETFKELYDLLFQSLCVFGYKFLQDKNDTEDIVQESLITYWKKRENFKNFDSVKAFLYTITKNRILNKIRDSKIHQKYCTYIKHRENFYFKNEVIETETYNAIHKAIAELPDQTRRIVELSLKGLKNKDIANQLEVSVNTIKTLKSNGYKTLRKKLADNLYALVILSILLQ